MRRRHVSLHQRQCSRDFSHTFRLIDITKHPYSNPVILSPGSLYVSLGLAPLVRSSIIFDSSIASLSSCSALKIELAHNIHDDYTLRIRDIYPIVHRSQLMMHSQDLRLAYCLLALGLVRSSE